MNFEPLNKHHVLAIKDPLHLPDYVSHIDEPMAVEMARLGGWAAVDDWGPVAIGGIYQLHHDHGHAWTWLTRRWRKYAKAITARAVQEIEGASYRRIEAAARCDLPKARAWLERMGFDLECERMRSWGVDGGDYALFARVKDG